MTHRDGEKTVHIIKVNNNTLIINTVYLNRRTVMLKNVLKMGNFSLG